MAKKDFSNISTGRVYSTIEEATSEPEATAQEMAEVEEKQKKRKTYTAQEAAEFMQNFKTSGRKGIKLPRINLAFAPDLYEYIQTMSRVRGENLTEFVNNILREHMEEHNDIYQKAIEFKNSL